MANIKNKTEKITGLTKREKELIAEKTGYAYATVNQVLLNTTKINKRNRIIIRIAKKMLHYKKLHEKNYMKDMAKL